MLPDESTLPDPEENIPAADAAEPGEMPDAEPVEGADGPDDVTGDGADEPRGQPAQGKANRGQNRIQALANARIEADKRAAAAEARAQAYEQMMTRNQAPQGPSASDIAAERERLALMSPEDRSAHERRQTEDKFNQTLSRVQLENADIRDSSAFERLRMRDPAIEAVGDRVETELAAMRRQGQNISREAIANFIIGQDARAQSAKARERQTKKAAVVTARETARPTNSRSTVAATPARSAGASKSLRARLKGVQI